MAEMHRPRPSNPVKRANPTLRVPCAWPRCLKTRRRPVARSGSSARILRLSGRDMPVNECAWGFQEFDHPGGMAAAARRANAADVLVVAAWCDTAAFARVAEWLQHWLAPRREKDGALVSIGLERADSRPDLRSRRGTARAHRPPDRPGFLRHPRSTPAAEFPRHGSTAPLHETRLPPNPFLASDDPARADRG